MIKQIKDEMSQIARNCNFYRERGRTSHLINEVGALRGVMYAADILGIEYPKEEYYENYIKPIYEMMKEE